MTTISTENFMVYKFLWISWYVSYPQKVIHNVLSKSNNDCTNNATPAGFFLMCPLMQLIT